MTVATRCWRDLMLISLLWVRTEIGADVSLEQDRHPADNKSGQQIVPGSDPPGVFAENKRFLTSKW